jgi:ankyrin repeat protein
MGHAVSLTSAEAGRRAKYRSEVLVRTFILISTFVLGVVCWLPLLRAGDAWLVDAAERADWEALRSALAKDSDVNAAQVDGMTALHWAVYHDHTEAVKLILEAGAVANRYGVAPLSLACMNGNEEVVELLLSAGADPETSLPGGETALMTAARTGRVGPIKSLIARGADVNAQERKGQTALSKQ